MLPAAIQVIVVVSALTILVAVLFTMAKDANRLMRLTIRVGFIPFPEGIRKWLATASPQFAYYYVGTTGDNEQDRRIEHRMRLGGRVFVILTFGGFLSVFLLGIVISAVS